MAHALLSPSAAHRWLHCPAAPRLEAQVKDEGSIYAAEGSLAHEICERKLKDEPYADLLGDELHTAEMDEHTDYYRDAVMAMLNEARKTTPDAKLLVEQTLDLTHWLPDGFGTADAIILADDTLNVIDFKYGKGVEVSADHNPQMMIYALGALFEHDIEYDISRVRMTIIQPRLDNISTFEIEATELTRWGDDILRPAAQKAYKGGGEQSAGEWCKFCAVKANCKALAEYCTTTYAQCQDARLLSIDDLAALLPKLSVIKSWCGLVEDYALQTALDGSALPGYKIVEGRSIRSITNPARLEEQWTAAGYAAETLYKPREVQTITALEKITGKKKFAEVSDGCIVKPQGKPTLVPMTDKRKPWSSAAADFANVKIED